jgi:hypothetical protein
LWEKNVDPGDVREKGSGDIDQSIFMAIPVIVGGGAVMVAFFWYKGRPKRIP